MRYFPIFVDLNDAKIIVSGAGNVAVAKLRLLAKTSARISVYGVKPAPEIVSWAKEGKIFLFRRPMKTVMQLVRGSSMRPTTIRLRMREWSTSGSQKGRWSM